MCYLSVDVDQSIDTIAPVFDVIDVSGFYIRSVRAVPVAATRELSLHLSLGGGSASELHMLMRTLQKLPAVLSMTHSLAEG
jgi:acetolactate synthase regulatory subunit